jgi:hypothetical protein
MISGVADRIISVALTDDRPKRTALSAEFWLSQVLETARVNTYQSIEECSA